jgi:hypothetical protein
VRAVSIFFATIETAGFAELCSTSHTSFPLALEASKAGPGAVTGPAELYLASAALAWETPAAELPAELLPLDALGDLVVEDDDDAVELLEPHAASSSAKTPLAIATEPPRSENPDLSGQIIMPNYPF